MKEIMYPPITHWEVTPLCNHNCRHCYNYWRTGKDYHFLILDNHKRIAEKIVERKPISVVITGGEPLLVFEKIKESLIMLRKQNILVSINTNASLINEEIALFLKENNISAFVSFPCFIPEICEQMTNTDGAFEKIKKGISILCDYQVKTSINMVVSQKNKHHVYDTAKYIKEQFGINSFFASRVSKPINSTSLFDDDLLTQEDTNYLIKELIRIQNSLNIRVSCASPLPACALNSNEIFQKFAFARNCTAGRISYSIDSGGNVKACPRDNEIYGNILYDEFSKIWDKMSEWRNGELIPEGCKACNVCNMCRGGCRLERYPDTGSKKEMDLLCNKANLPVKYARERKVIDLLEIDKIKCFSNVIFVEEGFGWRISSGINFIYITQEFKNFLEVHNEFYIKDLVEKFSIDNLMAKKIIEPLLMRNILYIKKER